jgi:DNA mismatch repair protein MSH3
LGRGTSTHDGVAIAYSTLQYLVESLGCFSLFVTHYPLLAELENSYPLVPIVYFYFYFLTVCMYEKSVANYHMSFLEEEDEEAGAPPRFVLFTLLAPPLLSANNTFRVTFLFKVTRGAAKNSYGLNVARIAGIQTSVSFPAPA